MARRSTRRSRCCAPGTSGWTATRPEPLIYMAWLRALNLAIYSDELGELIPDYSACSHRHPRACWTERQPAGATMSRPTAVETCADALRTSLATALDEQSSTPTATTSTAWRWGEAHRAALTHRVFAQRPADRRPRRHRHRGRRRRRTPSTAAARRSPTPTRRSPTCTAPASAAIYDLADLTQSALHHRDRPVGPSAVGALRRSGRALARRAILTLVGDAGGAGRVGGAAA